MKQDTQIKTWGNILINNVFFNSSVLQSDLSKILLRKKKVLYLFQAFADFMPA